MTIEFTLTKQDLFNFNFYVGWASPEKKNFRIKYYLKSVLWPLVAVMFVLFIGNKKLSIELVFSFIAFGLLAGFLGAYVGINSVYRRKIEKFIADPNNAKLLVRTQLILDDGGISSKDEYSETNYDWNAIAKKSETKDCFYLFLNSVNAIVIPKGILNEKEQAQLVDLLNRNLTLTAEFNTVFFSLTPRD